MIFSSYICRSAGFCPRFLKKSSRFITDSSAGSMLSKEKRKQEKDFIEIRAKELGRLEVQKEILGTLTNGATALPWYLPDQETMEEMIHDEVCKVCGRPAHKGKSRI
mgnify:FL=1